MSPLRRAWATLVTTFVVVVALGLCACVRDADAGGAGPLWADPGVVAFDTQRVEAAIEIHNISATARPIGEFALVGPDWGSLRFVDDSLPRTIPAHESVVVRVAISRATLRTQPGVYRSGHAGLHFESDQHTWEIPIEFVGTAEREPGAPPAWLAIVVLALIGVGVTTVGPRGRGPGEAAGVRPVVGGALAAMLLLVATLPWGSGLCLGRTSARVGPAELGQCRDGLGGFELTLLPADPGVWWLLIGLALATGLTAVVRSRDRSAALALALAVVQVLGVGVVVASLLVGLAPASAATVDLVLAQLRLSEQLGGFAIPAWGVVAQPIAFAACVVLVVAVPGPADRAGEGSPVERALARFARLTTAAVLVVLFLGGWAIPGLSERQVPVLTHAGMLGLELGAFVAKIALVDLGLRTLGHALGQRGVDPARLLRVHARVTLPVLLANLLGVALWRAF